MDNIKFFVYLFCAVAITYLIRMLPFVLFKKEIKNKYVLSFLHYIPYAVLAVMTIPHIFSSTSHTASAVVGTVVAVVLAIMEKSLLTVAAISCVSVFVVEFVMRLI